jgi:hypothetical protein
MYVCQWHLDLKYGTQGEALKAMKAWGAEKMRSSEFKRVKGTRLLVGHVGPSASHVVDEYVFESLADFEAALAGMSQPQFKEHSDALAPFVVPGSQHWEILRIVG